MTDPPLEDLGDPREMAPFSLEIILLDTKGRRSLRHILLVALADMENGRQKKPALPRTQQWRQQCWKNQRQKWEKWRWRRSDKGRLRDHREKR